MKATLTAFAFAALALPAAAQEPAPPRQDILPVQVLAEGAPMPAREVGRGREFYVHQLLLQPGLVFDVGPEAVAALQRRYRLEENEPFLLTEWLVAEGPDGRPRHLGYLYCQRYVRGIAAGETNNCLRDSDDDGRLDGLATFKSHRFPADGLVFRAIEPVAFRFVQRSRVAPAPSSVAHTAGALGLVWDRDRPSGRLLFRAQRLGLTYSAYLQADIDPPVEVDPASLPATIEIAGASVTIISWDGRRPTVRVDRGFEGRPVRITAADPVRALTGGHLRGWSMEFSDIPLPGAPPQR